jgi:hypothetical protein
LPRILDGQARLFMPFLARDHRSYQSSAFFQFVNRNGTEVEADQAR